MPKKVAGSLVVISTTLMILASVYFLDHRLSLETRATSFIVIQYAAFLGVGLTMYSGMSLIESGQRKLGRIALGISLLNLGMSPVFIVTIVNLIVTSRFVTNNIWIKAQLIVLTLASVGLWNLVMERKMRRGE